MVDPIRLSTYVDKDGIPSPDAFFTTSKTLPSGKTRQELAEMLTIDKENVGGILRIKVDDTSKLGTPHNRFEIPGFINGGKTKGGEPEFVMKNDFIYDTNYKLELFDD